MKKHEALIITAYTGTLLCDFNDFQEFASNLIGRPLFTHEMARPEIVNELKEKTKEEFYYIMRHLEE